MSFKIDFGPDWNKIKKDFASDSILQRAVPDITLSILKFHNTLEQRVDTLFNNKAKLSSVMIGRAVAPVDLARTFARYNLQYQSKAIPLSDFTPVTVTRKIVRNAIPVIKYNGTKGLIRVNKARVPHVKVRKGRLDVDTRQQKYFYVSKFKRIFARNQADTWDIYPELDAAGKIIKGSGTRAPIRVIFGPSLAQQAEGIFDKDTQIATAFTKMQDDITNAIVKSYNV